MKHIWYFDGEDLRSCIFDSLTGAKLLLRGIRDNRLEVKGIFDEEIYEVV